MRSKRINSLLKLALSLTLCACGSFAYAESSKESGAKAKKVNGEFQNTYNNKSKGLLKYIMMRWDDTFAEWPTHVPVSKPKPIPKEHEEELTIYYINHSTFLIQFKNVNILTDPVFSKRVSPFSFVGPKRVIETGVDKKNLPKIDYVIISHNHYDHLDIDFLNWISRRDSPLVFVGTGVGEIFNKKVRHKELTWYESYKNKNITITFTPAQHFSGRGLFDRNSTLWGAYVLNIDGFQMYFAGDTGYSPHFKEVYEKMGVMDVSFIPVGAYAPRSFMNHHHIDPAEAVQAHKDLHSKFSLGMHWGTFQLTSEPRLEPKTLTEKIVKEQKIDNFIVPENGYRFKKSTASEKEAATP